VGPINLKEIDSLEAAAAVNGKAQTHAMIVSSAVSSSKSTGVLSDAAALILDGRNEDKLRSPLSPRRIVQNLNTFSG